MRKRRGVAEVILNDVPRGWDWGWFARDCPQMYLLPVDREHTSLGVRVWLENNYKRTYQRVGHVPASVARALKRAVREHRRMIEWGWTASMITNGWLKLQVSLPFVTLTAYPGSPNEFIRRVDLRKWFIPEFFAEINKRDAW